MPDTLIHPTRPPASWAAVALTGAAGVLAGFAWELPWLLVPAVAALVAVAWFATPRAAAIGGWVAVSGAAWGAAHAPDGRWVRVWLFAAYALLGAGAAWVTARSSGRLPRMGGAAVVAVVLVGATQLPGPAVRVTGGARTAASAAGLSRADVRRIDDFMRDEMRGRRLPGAALAVIRDDEVLLVRGYGVAGTDRRQITPDTPFVLASISKSFTATAVVQLVAEGLVDLDSPIQDYLPDFRVADPEASTKITVRDLLVQTSGFSTRQGWGLIERSEQRSLDSEVRDLADATLAHPPGEQFEYSNRNFQVAGLVVEAVSGQSYAGYMREHVFGPLGMDHTFATHASAIRGGLADGYRAWFGVPISHAATIIEGVVPAAGIASSASDMARWLVANLTGDRRVLPRASFDELHAPAVPFDRGQDSLSDGDEFYAMGWIVAQDRGEPSTIRYEHGGTAPQYSLGMQIRPEPGWGVAVLVNDQASLAMPGTSLTDGVMDLLLGEPRAGVARDFTARYLLLDLFAVLIVSLLVRSVTGLRGWRNRFARRRIRAGVWGAFLHLVVPVAIIVGVPWVTGSWWRLIATYGPDLTLVLWATSLTLLGVGVAKVVLHVTRRRGDEQAVTAAG